MKHRREFIARNQTALQSCVREVVGRNMPANVRSTQTSVHNTLPPYNFQIYAQVGEELYRRVYVEYDERLTSLQRDLIDFKVAFIREGRLLGDTQWQHHRFKTTGHLPEAAAAVLTRYIRQYVATGVVPTYATLSHSLESLIQHQVLVENLVKKHISA